MNFLLFLPETLNIEVWRALYATLRVIIEDTLASSVGTIETVHGWAVEGVEASLKCIPRIIRVASLNSLIKDEAISEIDHISWIQQASCHH